MSQTQETILLNKLQQQDAAEVLAWLKRIESGQELPVAGFNWLGLAELAAFGAHWKSNLLWAEVATSVYDRLAAENQRVFDDFVDVGTRCCDRPTRTCFRSSRSRSPTDCPLVL